MNLIDEPRTLYRGTRIGEAHAITGCFDDSEDSEDEGWLRDGHVKYHSVTMLQWRATFQPWRVVTMDP